MVSPYPVLTPSSERIGGASFGLSGNANRVACASITASIIGIFSSARSLDCACRALDADARNRSTKACMWARWAVTFSAARVCCIACSVRIRTNSL